jgi:hypothetical protein
MDPQTAVCYQFYNKKGQRLSTFCRYINATTAEVYMMPCSKDDQFVKAEGRSYYEKYLAGEPHLSQKVELVDILPEEGTLTTLMRYASKNLYRKAILLYVAKKDILEPIKYIPKYAKK